MSLRSPPNSPSSAYFVENGKLISNHRCYCRGIGPYAGPVSEPDWGGGPRLVCEPRKTLLPHGPTPIVNQFLHLGPKWYARASLSARKERNDRIRPPDPLTASLLPSSNLAGVSAPSRLISNGRSRPALIARATACRPERQLAATFQAARSTVRRALDQLEKAGLVLSTVSAAAPLSWRDGRIEPSGPPTSPIR